MRSKEIVFIVAGLFACAAAAQEPGRWSQEKANAWYAEQLWLVGANYVPSDAINQLEMFQAATWNPELNDKELGLAEGIGMNTMRVFLQDQLWEQDPGGVQKAARCVSGDCIAAWNPADPGAVRFMLGSASEAGAAASSDPRRA